MNSVLTVTVRDRHGVHFTGEAKSISSTNKNGLFDILPGHAHFISLITSDVIINTVDGQKSSFSITSQGMLSVVNDVVTILLGIIPDEQ